MQVIVILLSLLFASPLWAQVSSSVPIGTTAQHKIYSAATAINTLSGIVADVGANTITATIYGTISYGAGTVVPANLTLDLSQGMIDCQSAVGAVTILGPIIAPLEKQIFNTCGSGTLKVTNGGTFSAKWVGAVGNGVTDDTLPVQAAIDAVGWGGGGTVLFPGGNYLLNTPQDSDGSNHHVLFIGWDNMTLRGQSGAVLTSTANLAGGQTLSVGGMVKSTSPATRPTSFFTQKWYVFPTAAQFYSLSGTSTRGTTTLTLVTASDANHFAAGDYILVRTGNCTGGTSTTEPDSEIQIVSAVDAGLGTLTLQRPLIKTYVQEYFISGTGGKTSASVTANPAIYGVANVTDRTIENFTIRDLEFHGSTTDGFLLNHQIFGMLVENVIFTGRNFTSENNVRQLICRNSYETHTQPTVDTSFLCEGATGVSDVLVDGNTFSGPGFVHIHEGVANYRLSNNIIDITSQTNSFGDLSIHARGYNIQVRGNYINSPNSHARIDLSENNDGIIENNIIGGPNATLALTVFSTPSTNWLFKHNVLLDGLTIPASFTSGDSSSTNYVGTTTQDFSASGTTLVLPKKSDPGSPTTGELWVNGADFKFRNNAGSPSTQTLLPVVLTPPTTGETIVYDGTNWANSGTVTGPAFGPSVAVVFDDFWNSNSSNGTIGQLGWSLSTIGSAPVVTYQAASANHYGVITLGTNAGATAGQGGSLTLSASVTNGSFFNLGGHDGWDSYFICHPGQLTNIRTRCGFFLDHTTIPPQTWMGIRYDTNATYGDTNYVYECCTAGTCTPGVTGQSVSATVFQTFRIRRPAGTVLMSVDGGAEVSLASNCPTGQLTAGFQIATDTNAAKTLFIDYWAFRETGLGR